MQIMKSETILSAKEAREMSVQQMLRLQQIGDEQHPSDVSISQRLVQRCLAEIRRQAEKGKTEAVFAITEWTVRARDRGEVFQQITREIDGLGFNILVERESSIWGRKIVYKIEW